LIPVNSRRAPRRTMDRRHVNRREPMVDFTLQSRIEHDSPGTFVARVRAIPVNAGERVAPEERACICFGRNHAHRALRRLERELERDIRARGNRLAVAAEPGL
jgi:hypothetical protein